MFISYLFPKRTSVGRLLGGREDEQFPICQADRKIIPALGRIDKKGRLRDMRGQTSYSRPEQDNYIDIRRSFLKERFVRLQLTTVGVYICSELFIVYCNQQSWKMISGTRQSRTRSQRLLVPFSLSINEYIVSGIVESVWILMSCIVCLSSKSDGSKQFNYAKSSYRGSILPKAG